jgi:hypothetical protein
MFVVARNDFAREPWNTPTIVLHCSGSRNIALLKECLVPLSFANYRHSTPTE